MRMRTVILGLGLVVAAGLMCEASAQAVAQNANKPAAKKAKPAAKPAEAKPAAAAAAPAAPAAQTMTAAKAKPKPKPKRKPSGMHGVPNGVAACVKHLQVMAEKDPLIDYEGHPSEIVNNGLLWNDPRSHCSVSGDPALKFKAMQLANAWRLKETAFVRSLLTEMAAAAGSN